MSRSERRKLIKVNGFKAKTVNDFRKQVLALPMPVQALLKATIEKYPIPESVIDEAKDTWPEYFNDEGEFEPIKWK